jgi:hypothetical protein
MSTQTAALTNTAPPAAASQETVNSAPDFETAANSVLDFQPEEAKGTSADAGKTGDAGKAAEGVTQADQMAAAGAREQGKEAVAAAQTQADEWAVDQALLDKALADPTHGPIVKALQEKYQRAVESVKIWGPEAQEAKALVPGGLPELKEVVEIAKSARTENADFASGVPERQKSALQSIADELPEQFAAGIPLYMEIAGQKNPQARESYLRGELTRTLEADGVIGALQTAFDLMAKGDKATTEDEQAFGQAMQQLHHWADKAGFAKAKPAGGAAAAKTAAVDPEKASLQAKVKEYEEREHKQNVESFTTWFTPTAEEISKTVREDAKARLEEFLPKNIETNFRNFTMNGLLDQIETRLTEQLRADTGTQDKLAAVLAGNAWKTKAAESRTQYVNLSVGRAKQLLPYIVAEVMKPAAAAAVAGAQQRTEAQKTAAGRPDVTGAGGSPRPTKWTPKDMRAGGALTGKSDEEILDL